MDEQEGLRVVLSPVQLAAVLEGQHLSAHEIFMNRLWGGARLAGGLLELLAGAGLLLTPEPTMLTKAGGGVLVGHGSDTTIAGARQIWSGEPTKDLTQMAGEAAARTFGASDQNAERVGTGIDVAVPLVVVTSVAAARILAVRAGRFSLAAEEAAGGHTILKHVGQTEAQLRARLLAETRIPAASSFSTLRAAEDAVSAGLKANTAQIRAWASAANNLKPLVLDFDAGSKVGYGVVRSTGTLTDMQGVRIVLRMTRQAGKLYYVLTSYPIP
jgi:Bacterial CdiA-CT RNAse A domain